MEGFQQSVVVEAHDFNIYDPIWECHRRLRDTAAEATRAYVDRVAAAPGVAKWIEQARAEQDYLDFEEPYRTHR